jgi:hypothetical protein
MVSLFGFTCCIVVCIVSIVEAMDEAARKKK